MNISDNQINIISTTPFTLPSNSCNIVLINNGALNITLPPVQKQNSTLRIVNQSETIKYLFYKAANPLQTFYTLQASQFVDLLPYSLGDYYLLIGQGTSNQELQSIYPETVVFRGNTTGQFGPGQCLYTGITSTGNWTKYFSRGSVANSFVTNPLLVGNTVQFTLETYTKDGVSCNGIIYIYASGVWESAAQSSMSSTGGANAAQSLASVSSFVITPLTFGFGSSLLENVASFKLTAVIQYTTNTLVPV